MVLPRRVALPSKSVKLLLYENPLPLIDEAITVAEAEVAHGNYARAHNLADFRFGSGFMRITTALPEDNRRFIAALEQILLCASTTMEQGG